jgi:SAM-dependent methyltransferase
MRLLGHPLARGLNIDDPRTTSLRRRIIQEKPFLHRLYGEWYEIISRALPQGEGAVLELGSGAGFLSDHVSDVIPSEIFFCDDIRIVLDGQKLPFADSCLRAIVMVDVFHHLPNVRLVLREAARCVRSNGKIIMIEPWVTPWSQWVYRHFHHEPFLPESIDWEFAARGPLSGANGALPWIVFSRDRHTFDREFPEWRISEVQLMMPFSYLLSGGVSFRSFFPGFLYEFWRSLERRFASRLPSIAMFAQIILERTAD